MLTLKSLNKEFKEMNENLTLYKHNDGINSYFYFVLDDGGDVFEDYAMMVHSLNMLTKEQWLGNADMFLELVKEKMFE